MPLIYAKVGGPPANWNRLDIKKNGVSRHDVFEVDVLGCWAMVFARDSSGHLMDDGSGGAANVKEYGNWSIEEKSPEPCSLVNDPAVAGSKDDDQNDPGDSDPSYYYNDPMNALQHVPGLVFTRDDCTLDIKLSASFDGFVRGIERTIRDVIANDAIAAGERENFLNGDWAESSDEEEGE